MSRSQLIHVLRNEAGGPRAYPLEQNDERAENLCRAIASGLQSSLARSKTALEELEALERGELERVTFGGNDQGIRANENGAVFYSHHVDDPWHSKYSIKEVKDALKDWIDLLNSRG